MIVTVYATFADADEAKRIARILVEERLAACANILGPCDSIYRWEGKIEEQGEVAALFKTKRELADKLVERLGELHSYLVPAAVAWPIEGVSAPFKDWVTKETK